MSATIHDELTDTHKATQGRRVAADRAPGPIPTAFAELADRNDRLENLLGQLADTVDDLTRRLGPLLPDAPPAPALTGTPDDPTPGHVDNRGQIARTVSSQARRVDAAADRVDTINHHIGHLLDELEL